MTDQYNQEVAAHYAVYRPPLHQMILKRVLSGTDTFSEGLDIGCGTGYSSIALAAYCSHVFGIDPSPSMLGKATQHKKVTYLEGSGENIPLADHSVDVVTLAGSLFYADINTTAEEIRRVCRGTASIIPYDFEILLNDHLNELEIDSEETDSGYDHSVNFSGIRGFEEQITEQERINLEASFSELAHVLLSDLYRYKAFAEKYNVEDPLPELEEQLKSESESFLISADIYFSKYRLAKIH